MFDGNAEAFLNECVIEELHGLSRSNINARIGLEMYGKLKILDGKGNGDDCILDSCSKYEMCLLSSDRNLLRRATALNIKTLTLQDGRKIGWF
jgi:rRNA-processing protein FCF1